MMSAELIERLRFDDAKAGERASDIMARWAAERKEAAEEIKRLRGALAEIARTTPAHVADGFVQGPRVLWLWAQRTARQALQGDADA